MTLNTQGAPIIVAERIIEWRSYLQRRRTIDSADIAKFEQQLMAHHVELQKAGLDDDEAFLIAVKRIGDQQSRVWGSTFEFADQLWKQLNAMRSKNKVRVSWGAEAVVAIGLAIAAALAIKVPELMGVRIDGSDANPSFYARNLSLFVLPFLAVYFVWKREVKRSNLVWMITPFALAAVLMNVIPFASLGSTELLAALHLPIAMWMLVGLSYASGNWRDHDHRMNYVRFSGEWFICYSLIALGGGVFMGITNMIFSAISLDVEWLVSTWILPCGAMGAVIIAGWLVESKQNLLESMAPILTLLFTPLFTVLLLAFLTTMLWTGKGINVERDVLIGFDLLLVVVVGLLLYAISARDPFLEPSFFDGLQLVLVVCALLADAIALCAILARISELGFSPNRVAALG